MQANAIMEDPAAKRSWDGRLKRALAAGARALLILLLWLCAYVLYEIAQNNFHTVVAGTVYRSSSMSPDSLSQTIQAHHIQSVLSLIPASLAESNTLRSLGVHYLNLPLSDRHEVRESQMEAMITAMRTAPKPLLIHCKAGADRTGLACALYKVAIEGRPAAKADQELTVFYGHMPPWLGFSSRAMDLSFWRYVHRHPPANVTNN